MRFWAQDLLHFWFHELRPADWFVRRDAVDAALERRFGRWLVALGQQQPTDFLGDPDTARAAILLFDQCARNFHRDNGRAFACDPLARAICHGMIARGWDQRLPRAQAQFVYMPLMHSEAIADQLESVRLFTRLGSSFSRRFAIDHYRMIARFGRFPHRNALLGRASTAAEKRAIAAGNAW